MIASPPRPARRLGDFAAARVEAWRSGSRRSQLAALAVLLAAVAGSFVVSLINYQAMPVTAYFVWLLLGMLLLRFRPLLVLCGAALCAAVVAVLSTGEITGARTVAVVALLIAVGLLAYQSSLQRSGLPGWRGEAMLAELRERLQAQGVVPPLPTPWVVQSAMLSASGNGYAGDFLVAELSEDERSLEMILVDVCGKGVGAATQAFQFAGALGGLVGSLPPRALLEAANSYLLRQFPDDSFATAVHALVNLETGDYSLHTAGHPPALRWCARERDWLVDGARGTALGILPRPELYESTGTLGPGEALMFYTDGVIESREADLDAGLAWLRRTAGEAVADGFAGAARRIVRQVARGDDDRAVLILSRE